MTAFPSIGSSIIALSEIDSTNNYAMQLAAAGLAEHGTVITADYQTQGRGQHGNQWQSEAGENLLFSIILDTSKEKIEDQFLLNAVFCTALAHALMEHYELEDTSIKWPNDIYVKKKKIAGTLIENVIRGHQWQYAIVGIGMNVNQTVFPAGLQATSIKNLLDDQIMLHDFRAVIFNYLNQAYHQFLNNKAPILTTYNNLLHGFGQEVSFFKNQKKQQGTLYGAEPQGFLKIDDTPYRHGQIRLLI